MFDLQSGLKLIPAWAFQYVFAGVIWVGFNYLFLTPLIFDRVTLPYKKEFHNAVYEYNLYHFHKNNNTEAISTYVDCVYSKYFYKHRESFTKWTASLGYISELDGKSMKKELDDIVTSSTCGNNVWEDKL